MAALDGRERPCFSKFVAFSALPSIPFPIDRQSVCVSDAIPIPEVGATNVGGFLAHRKGENASTVCKLDLCRFVPAKIMKWAGHLEDGNS
jgi:hypothetical protein